MPAPADAPQSWPVRASRDIWRGDAPFAVRQDVLEVPGSAETFDRLVVEHPGAVAVLALDESDRVLVLEQYRHPLGMRIVELPAGVLDKPGEDPVEAARRELLEEGAITAEHWRHLTTTHTSPGICSERIELYLAQGLSEVPDRGGFDLQHEEADMTASWVGFDDLVAAVLAGRVTDGPLQVAVLALLALRGEGRSPGTSPGTGPDVRG